MNPDLEYQIHLKVSRAFCCFPDTLSDETESALRALMFAVFQTAMTSDDNGCFMPDEQQEWMLNAALELYHEEQERIGLR